MTDSFSAEPHAALGVDEHAALGAKLAQVAPQLDELGYAVIDDVFSPAAAAALHDDMSKLRTNGGLRQHRFAMRLSTGQPHIFTKPHIYEAEVDDEAVRRLTPHLAAALQNLQLHTAAAKAFPSLGITASATGVAFKLQCNEGGCFPLHYDNAGPPSRRKLTALFYLNREWQESHGGELQLLPWLQPPVALAPLYNRARATRARFKPQDACTRIGTASAADAARVRGCSRRMLRARRCPCMCAQVWCSSSAMLWCIVSFRVQHDGFVSRSGSTATAPTRPPRCASTAEWHPRLSTCLTRQLASSRAPCTPRSMQHPFARRLRTRRSSAPSSLPRTRSTCPTAWPTRR